MQMDFCGLASGGLSLHSRMACYEWGLQMRKIVVSATAAGLAAIPFVVWFAWREHGNA
jgi:hypothetical protein